MAIWVFKIPNNVRLREGMGKEQKERGECRLEVLDSEDEREGKERDTNQICPSAPSRPTA